MHLRRRRQVTTAGLAVCAVALAACSSSSSSSSSNSTSAGTTSAPAAASSSANLSGTLNGSGSTFQTVFQQSAIAAFRSVDSGITVNYGAGGSGKGRTDLASDVVNFAGSDSPIPAADVPLFKGKTVLYFPVIIGPITMAYNLSGVSNLKLNPTVIANIFQGKITKWNDPAIASLNSGVSLPSTPITIAVRSDSSGTTQNFTLFLKDAVPSVWTLGSSSTVKWPSTARAGMGNPGVAQIVKSTSGAIGYVDYATAKASGLSFASVQNSSGVGVRRRGRGHRRGEPHLRRGLGFGRVRVPDHLPVVGPGLRAAGERERRGAAQGLPRLPARARPAAAGQPRLRAAAEQPGPEGRGAAESDHRLVKG